jgi:hypothetical protein
VSERERERGRERESERERKREREREKTRVCMCVCMYPAEASEPSYKRTCIQAPFHPRLNTRLLSRSSRATRVDGASRVPVPLKLLSSIPMTELVGPAALSVVPTAGRAGASELMGVAAVTGDSLVLAAMESLTWATRVRERLAEVR